MRLRHGEERRIWLPHRTALRCLESRNCKFTPFPRQVEQDQRQRAMPALGRPRCSPRPCLRPTLAQNVSLPHFRTTNMSL